MWPSGDVDTVLARVSLARLQDTRACFVEGIRLPWKGDVFDLCLCTFFRLSMGAKFGGTRGGGASAGMPSL